jgi:hypothetical protein
VPIWGKYYQMVFGSQPIADFVQPLRLPVYKPWIGHHAVASPQPTPAAPSPSPSAASQRPSAKPTASPSAPPTGTPTASPAASPAAARSPV